MWPPSTPTAHDPPPWRRWHRHRLIRRLIGDDHLAADEGFANGTAFANPAPPPRTSAYHVFRATAPRWPVEQPHRSKSQRSPGRMTRAAPATSSSLAILLIYRWCALRPGFIVSCATPRSSSCRRPSSTQASAAKARQRRRFWWRQQPAVAVIIKSGLRPSSAAKCGIRQENLGHGRAVS